MCFRVILLIAKIVIFCDLTLSVCTYSRVNLGAFTKFLSRGLFSSEVNCSLTPFIPNVARSINFSPLASGLFLLVRSLLLSREGNFALCDLSHIFFSVGECCWGVRWCFWERTWRFITRAWFKCFNSYEVGLYCFLLRTVVGVTWFFRVFSRLITNCFGAAECHLFSVYNLSFHFECDFRCCYRRWRRLNSGEDNPGCLSLHSVETQL